MLAAPFAIRKWGKKKVLIVTNAVNAMFLALLYPVVQAEPAKMIVYIAIILFGNYLMTSFGIILNPAVNADIRDYQQYITGEHIDGMFATVDSMDKLKDILAKPYIDAEKLLKQAENYQHYEDIKSIYEDAKLRSEEAARIEEEKAKALEAEQKAMKEKLKAKKPQKKADKKNR